MSESWRVLALLASVLLWAAVGVAWAAEAGILTRLRQGWRVCPPLRRTLAALVVAAAVAYAGVKGDGGGGVSSKEKGAGDKGVSSKEKGVSAEGSSEEVVRSKEQVVSAEFSSSVVARDGTQQDVAHHTYSLLLPPSSLNPAPYSLTDADISRGYRLVAVVTNEAHSYAMSPDARLVGTWHLTDAYDAVARGFLEGVSGKEEGVSAEGSSEEGVSSKEKGVSVESLSSVVAAGGTEKEDGNLHTYSLLLAPSSLSHSPFSFPLGVQVVTSLWAHVWGRARPQLWNASNELVAVGAPMFARRGVSRLWTAATTNGSALLTWQDFFFKGASSKEKGTGGEGVRCKEKGVSAEFSSSVVARDGTQQDVAHHTYSFLLPPSSLSQRTLLPTPCSFSPVSAQLELFRDGSFVAWSNSVARVYRRVNPDDWDGDGIPNGEDENPRVAADEPRFGPRQSLPPGAHTNNYYWIDLAVRDADALVAFAGDAPSDLPDPSFVAKAGETNRVTLLIGKRYTIHSLLPAEVVGTSDPEVEVGRDGAQTTVRWPGRCEYVDAALPPSSRAAGRRASAAGRGGTALCVVPARLRGVFGWPGSFCCWEPAPDGSPVFACGGACGCGGCSTGDMTFTLEGYAFTFAGRSCGCSHASPDEPRELGDGDDGEPNPLPGASARFMPSAVIFEDAYEPSDGVKVPRRSTRTTLVCSASGGPNGGTARFEAMGDDCVLRVSGLTLPLERRLGPGEGFETEVVYEGQKGLGHGFRVTASFTDDSEDAQTAESVARLDVAEIEIMVREYAPANDSPWRHTFGVCEEISCNSYPSGIGLRWIADEGVLIDACNYRCPSRAASNPLKAVCGGVEFTPAITVLEPSGIEARKPRCQSYGAKPGRAGWIGLRQEFFATPLDVSFRWLHMEEVPSTVGRRMGYFARPGFDAIGCHSEAMGAGTWLALDRDNRMGECDITRITTELLRVNDVGDLTDDPAFGWENGWIAWEIPFGWTTNEAIRENPKAIPLRVFDPNAGHRIEITSAGLVTVRKFGNCVQRDVGGRMTCNGIEWKEEK